MDEILNLNVNEIAGLSFECSCGKEHSVDIRKIAVGRNAINEVLDAAADFKGGKIFLVADSNTYTVYGEQVEKSLINNGFKLKTHIFDTPYPRVPDEKAAGRLLIELEKNTSLILTIGSGVLNDLSRILSYKTNIPYIIVGTAPSMDGYASVVSPLIIDGVKVTMEGTYPLAIIADTDVLKDAPMEMLHAGFGDIIGKLTVLADWNLSAKLNNEHFCATCAQIVRTALQKCIDNVDGLKSRDGKAIEYVMEALVLSGIAIGLNGNSRPASGAEHNFAHYWDMDAIARNEEHPLHGNSVGVATVVTASVYEQMKSYLPSGVGFPKPETIIGLLNKIGAICSPKELGIKRKLFEMSMLNAMKLKPRYTIFNFAQEKGMLEDIVGKLTEEFYGYK